GQVTARRHDVDRRAVVRVRGALVGEVGGADGDEVAAVRRGEVGRGSLDVACGGHDHSELGGDVDGVLPGGWALADEAQAEVEHVCWISVGRNSGRASTHCPVHRVDDVGDRASAVTEHAQG